MTGIMQAVKFIGMGDTIEIWPADGDNAGSMTPEEFGAALEQLMGGSDTTSDTQENEEAQ